MIDTPTAHGAPLFSAAMKREPDDFHVTEELTVDFDGKGEHLWLSVEKRGLGTPELIEKLQAAYGVSSADVGYTGMKDKVAFTRQWVSVRTSLPATQVEFEDVRIVDSVRHGRKLRHGTHSGNRFEIILRDVVPHAPHAPDAEAMHAPLSADAHRELIAQRLQMIRDRGFPNYLGPQRFGINGRNLIQAEQWFRNPKKRLSRSKRGFLLSAARSALFNDVCAWRVKQGCWQCLLPGEPAILAGSRSFFVPEHDDHSAAQRCAEQDIHPSGPWWGRGNTLALRDCNDLEQAVLAKHEVLCKGLERAGLEQTRRSLRATVSSLSHDWLNAHDLRLRFSLSPGVFATTLLAECGRCVQHFAAHEDGETN